MEISWKNIGEKENAIVEGWLSEVDKHNLCMSEKSWGQTATDIEDCLKFMKGSQFKNIIGHINGKPVCAAMFAVEKGGLLNLYNIVVNPAVRGRGVAKSVVLKLLNNDVSLNITEKFTKVKVSALPDNKIMENILKSLNFNEKGFDGDYNVFEKNAAKEIEMV